MLPSSRIPSILTIVLTLAILPVVTLRADDQSKPNEPEPQRRPLPTEKIPAPGRNPALKVSAASPQDQPPEAPAPSDWRETERSALQNHVQLTFADRFIRAGESYFSPDDSKIIFQAIELPKQDADPLPFYSMFVADVVRDGAGKIQKLANVRRISPEGSANTCGWFHPTDRNVVIFGSTITPPTESKPPGWQRAEGQYRWMFPPEMQIVRCELDQADGTAATVTPLLGDGKAYIAECSISPDGRHLLYSSLESNQGDLFVKDLVTGKVTRLVSAQGYDGGPFFAPDGRRIIYRSDRNNNNLLQVFVGELAFNDEGTIVGLERESQLTDNHAVNWAPYWHPQGRHVIYTSSGDDHRNYDVFMIDADPGNLPGSPGPVKYGTRPRRITFADGADVLPVFDSTGKTMLWTSKRDAANTSQVWAADFVAELDPAPPATSGYDPSKHRRSP